MQTDDLNQELVRIQAAASEQHRQYQSSRIMLYKGMAETYLWWRKASMEKDYIEGLYSESGIAFKKLGNRPNFNPLIRLIFNMQSNDAVQISNWAKAIEAIDEEYNARRHVYDRADPVGEITSFIADSGGLSGIRARQQYDLDESGGDVTLAASTSTRKPSDQTKKKKLTAEHKVVEQKKRQIAKSVSDLSINIGPVAANDDELLVLVARRVSANGELQIVGMSADNTLVNTAIGMSVDADFNSAQPVLRAIVEALRPSILPRAVQRAKARKNFFAKVRLNPPKSEAITVVERTRVVITTKNEILVSKTPSSASLVIIARPKVDFSIDRDLYLRGADRYWIETTLLNDSQIALYEATPHDTLADADPSLKALKQLMLKNGINGDQRNIYFYDAGILDDAVGFQPTVSNPSRIRYDWKVTANAKFVHRINHQHMRQWLARQAKIPHVAEHKSMEWVVTKAGIEVRSKYDAATKSYTRTGEQFTTPYNKDASCKLKGPSSVTFAPTDVTELFELLAVTKLNSDVIIEGNQHLLHVSYSTEMGKYDAYIPACDFKGRRDDKHFEQYVFNV